MQAKLSTDVAAIDDPVGLFDILDQIAVGSYGSVYKVCYFSMFLKVITHAYLPSRLQRKTLVVLLP
jgi:hypothetical protein